MHADKREKRAARSQIACVSTPIIYLVIYEEGQLYYSLQQRLRVACKWLNERVALHLRAVVRITNRIVMLYLPDELGRGVIFQFFWTNDSAPRNKKSCRFQRRDEKWNWIHRVKIHKK